jgi:hypothetical protein
MIRVPEIPDKLWELISECWRQEPEDRPSFAEITDGMLKSNYFVLDGTNLDTYHEYQQRIMSELSRCPIPVNNFAVLKSLRRLGLDVHSLRRSTLCLIWFHPTSKPPLHDELGYSIFQFPLFPVGYLTCISKATMGQIPFYDAEACGLMKLKVRGYNIPRHGNSSGRRTATSR